MNAREEILDRTRRALAGSARAAEVPQAPSVRTVPDLSEHFAERVRDYKASVVRCTDSFSPQEVLRALAGVRRVVVPPGLQMEVLGAQVDDDFRPDQLQHFDAVVTRCAVAIGETGTIVLDHSASQGRRILTLLPDLHVCLVDESQIVADVQDALAVLDPRRPQTWISGPSATSDIELERVEGVHGPRRLVVILTGDPPGGNGS